MIDRHDKLSREELLGATGCALVLLIAGLITWAVWPSSDEEAPVIHETGETVVVGDLDFTVNGSVWAKEIGERRPVKPSASFLLVVLTVHNQGKTAQLIPAPTLRDEQGAEYSMSFAGMLRLDESLNFAEILNPGVGRIGVMVFDVPRQDYQLYISTGLLWWEEEAFISLEITED